jgi:hypothetical protein
MMRLLRGVDGRAGGGLLGRRELENPQTHTLTSAAEFIKSLPKRKDRQFQYCRTSETVIAAVNGYAIGVAAS